MSGGGPASKWPLRTRSLVWGRVNLSGPKSILVLLGSESAISFARGSRKRNDPDAPVFVDFIAITRAEHARAAPHWADDRQPNVALSASFYKNAGFLPEVLPQYFMCSACVTYHAWMS